MNHKTLHVRKELLQNALEALFSSSIAFIVSVSTVVYILWNVTSHNILLLWSGILLLVTIFRVVRAKKILKNFNHNKLLSKEIEFQFLTILSVSIFSFGIFMFLPHEIVYQSFLTMILTAVSAGALMSLSFYKNLIISYVTILLFPFSMALLLENSSLHNFIVFLLVTFMILIIKFAIKHHNNILEIIISRLKYQKAQKEIQFSKDQFTTIFEQAPIGICTFDTNLTIINSNEALACILHVAIEKLIGFELKNISDTSLLPSLSATLSGEKGFYEGQYRTQIMELDLWISMQTVPLFDEDGIIQGGLLLLTDITQRIKADEKIRYQAFFDHLTGLANRLTIQDRLEKEIARLLRHKHFGAVIFIDIDHFKTINDSLGHDIGDELLKQFAQRISKITRKEDTIARLGGDEFVILLSELGDSFTQATESAYITAEKNHTIMQAPFYIKDQILHVTLSQGIAMIGDKETDIHTVLKNADIAMYEAKKAGRANSKFYEEEMTFLIQKRLELDTDLREAIISNQFELYYQPIVETQTGNIVSCEALIRWNHPTKGLVPPDEFIPYAEESGLIITLGQWVIESVCQTYLKWTPQTKSKIQSIAINISPKQFNQDDFSENFMQTLSKYKLDAKFLKLELTESVIINNLDKTIQKIKNLQKQGCQMSMDDFGTGYSSLSYLKNLPFDVIKIDRAFIKNILENEDDAILVNIILSISKQFNFEVVAEGVEEQKQIDFLKSVNCHYYQGYVVSKPIPSDSFEQLLLNSESKR